MATFLARVRSGFTLRQALIVVLLIAVTGDVMIAYSGLRKDFGDFGGNLLAEGFGVVTEVAVVGVAVIFWNSSRKRDLMHDTATAIETASTNWAGELARTLNEHLASQVQITRGQPVPIESSKLVFARIPGQTSFPQWNAKIGQRLVARTERYATRWLWQIPIESESKKLFDQVHLSIDTVLEKTDTASAASGTSQPGALAEVGDWLLCVAADAKNAKSIA